GTWLLKPNLKQVKRRIDYVEYGGALLLGVNGICVITHGSSKEAMVYHAIRLAKEAVEQKVLERLQTEMADNDSSKSNPRLSSRPSGSQPSDPSHEVWPLRPLDRVEG
ncbi:MAG: hypothetical protein Q6J46_11740, partial [Thermostichus sp. DG02_2_bins_29]